MDVNQIVLDCNSLEEDYKQLYELNVGDVFKIADDYEAVMLRIEHYTPENLIFEVFPINPGTSLYTMYGPDHCVVVTKTTKEWFGASNFNSYICSTKLKNSLPLYVAHY